MIQGVTALVTGGSGGIGKEIARVLLARGANVLLSGRDAAALARVEQELLGSARRETLQIAAADLSVSGEREALAAVARSWRGGIDILVNNAGVSGFAMLDATALPDIERTFETNLIAPIDLCRRLLPHLRTRASAHIVNIGSVFGAIGYPGFSVYSASKFALRGFSEALRRELEGTSVRVHYFAPRATRTAFNAASVERMNHELGVAMDSPAAVATSICALLEAGRAEATLGWPEKLFVKINAVLPGLVDRALRKQVPAVRKHAGARRDARSDHQSIPSEPGVSP
jgi:short-subunit dehydrogenase